MSEPYWPHKNAVAFLLKEETYFYYNSPGIKAMIWEVGRLSFSPLQTGVQTHNFQPSEGFFNEAMSHPQVR